MNVQRLTLITSIFVIIAGIGLIVYSRFQSGDGGQTTLITGELDYTGQPGLGDDDAPLKIAIFEDFKCPACQFFEENIFPEIEREFLDTGKARLYFFNFQFLGPDSTTAGIAGECAFHQSEAAFWEYKTVIYRAQGPERQRWATPTRLEELAQNVGDLDAGDLRTCIDEKRYEDDVKSDREIGNSLGVTGTPSMFINGEKVENPNDINAVLTLLNEALDSN